MSPCQGEGRGFESLPPLMNNDEKIYSLLRKIPKRKVTTYKILAQKAGLKNPRFVGRILHINKNPEKIPCYKVIKSDGSIATGYAYGGQKAQIDKLKSDGVEVLNKKIDIKKYLYKF